MGTKNSKTSSVSGRLNNLNFTVEREIDPLRPNQNFGGELSSAKIFSSSNNSQDSNDVGGVQVKDINSYIPAEYLNKFGFINYNHYGDFPWEQIEDVQIPEWYKAPTEYLGIDCEMVGVGHLRGDSVLGRVSIVTLQGFCIFDSFVRPEEEVTEYRTEFSGIRAEDLLNARSHEDVIWEVSKLVRGKILVGHSIHNDLEVLKLNDHVRVRDTAVYFQRLMNKKHPPSLKQLTKHYLQVDIQGAEHSSIQDAQATMKLYLLHREEWEQSINLSRERTNLDADGLIEADNYVSISDMHVYPREKDLTTDSKTVILRANKLIGAYSSSEEYKDTQFRILLEDLLRPLRNGVYQAKKINKWKGAATKSIPRAGFRYRNVSISGASFSGNEGETEARGMKTLMIPIDQNNLRNVDWEETKILLNGSLILLSPNNFKTVKFATVLPRVKSTSNPVIRDTDYFLKLKIKFGMGGPSWISNSEDKFEMMESVAFYEAYKHTLEYFQIVDLDEFPLKKYIVDAVTDPSPPKYLLNSRKPFDFSPLMQNQTTHLAAPFDYDSWPSASQLGLDHSQFEAFQKSLTQELTIIQGPPGTGKTFIGIQVVKFLLSNFHLVNSPILIVSYTNHSLDQVLEEIFHYISEKKICVGKERDPEKLILRIGGGSKSEVVEPLTTNHKKLKYAEQRMAGDRIFYYKRLLTPVKDLETVAEIAIIDFDSIPREFRSQLTKTYPEISATWSVARKLIKLKTNWKSLLPFKVSTVKKNSIVFLMKEEIDEDFSSFLDHQNRAKLFCEDKRRMECEGLGWKKKTSTSIDHWTMYFILLETLIGLVQSAREMNEKVEAEYKNVSHYLSRNQFLKAAKIIGMTTTGAVKYKDLVLKIFKSKIMIVEEAAHVLEAHVVASLTEHCQQMIMIGDHKQLRPMTADYDLAEKYNLDVSLMERLVKNGTNQGKQNWIQLQVQRRMRPEICQLITPVIYENLANHARVYKYPEIRGCKKNLFLIDHNVEEDRELGSSSRFNTYEAKFLAKLCQYFVLIGKYSPTQITIIVTYLDQKTLLLQYLNSIPDCHSVRISTVDGYQGEENDIILLSLVRSNAEGNVGFLKTDNRVCVALSRARYGLFMIGNMSILKNSSRTWDKVNEILSEDSSVGSHLPLQCPEHGIITTVSTPEDFNKILCNQCFTKLPATNFGKIPMYAIGKQSTYAAVPTKLKHAMVFDNSVGEEVLSCGHQKLSLGNGKKCRRRVTKSMPCGHTVEVLCGNSVLSMKCLTPVSKSLPCGHTNRLHCHIKASAAKCSAMVKIFLPCGCSKVIECHLQKTANHRHRCNKSEPITLLDAPFLGHKELKMKCLEDPSSMKRFVSVFPCGHPLTIPPGSTIADLDQIRCTILCFVKLPCGHRSKSLKQCGSDGSKIKCMVQISKKLPCGHNLQMKCFECSNVADLGRIKCAILCFVKLPCGHRSKSLKQCGSNGSKIKCMVQISKKLPCGHNLQMKCFECSNVADLGRIKCAILCFVKLPCGHRSRSIKPCGFDRSKIRCMAQISKKLPCGHDQSEILYCHADKSLIKCTTEVSKELDCGHEVTGLCHIIQKSKCQVPVLKFMQCGHELKVPCHHSPDVAKCNKLVKKNFPCGHQGEAACYLKAAAKCKTTVSRYLLCGHEQRQECHIPLSKSQCNFIVQALSCGHPCQDIPCHQGSAFKCNSTKKVTLKCGHEEDIPCHMSLENMNVTCSGSLSRILPCGHIQNTPCRLPNFPVKCNSLVETFACGHPCKKMHCHQRSNYVCITSVVHTLECGHEQKTQCNGNARTLKCNQYVKYLELACGHSVINLHCHQLAKYKCIEVVSKSLPCGHSQMAPCHLDVAAVKCATLVDKLLELDCGHSVKNRHCHQLAKYKCIEVVSKSLPCGHSQMTPCHLDVAAVKCATLLNKLDCGHEFKVNCHKKSTVQCPAACDKIFKCGHSCRLACHAQVDPRHAQYHCFKKCQRICAGAGHQCPGDHMCYLPCPYRVFCPALVTYKMTCGHMQDAPCHETEKEKGPRFCNRCSLGRINLALSNLQLA